MLFENQRALRVSPADFSSVATGLENKWSETTSAITMLETLVDRYRAVQKGPDIDVILTSTAALVDGFRSSISGFETVSTACSTAYRSLLGLETDSDNLWNEVGRVDGELTSERITDFSARFYDIRDAEEQAMATLASAIEQARTGTDVELDGSAVADVIGRLVDAVEAADINFDLTVAEMLLVDYLADSDFDTSTIELAKRERFHTQLVELDTDPEVAATLALTGDLDFVAAVIEVAEDDQHPKNGSRTVAEILIEVETAMVEGNTPNEVALPDELFPADYIELQELEAELEGDLRRELDDASGWVWLPDFIDSEDDSDARAVAEAKIDVNVARQAELREALGIEGDPGIGSDGELTIGSAAAVMIEHSGAGAFWGERFAFNLGENSWDDNKGSQVGFDYMAPKIAEDEATAVAFYNQLGPKDSAHIAGTYEEGMRETYVQLGDGLGTASASGDLEFDGAEYVRGHGPMRVSPIQLLAVSENIPSEFMVEATAESLRLSEHSQGAAYNTMGEHGPYTDTPDDVSFYPEPGTADALEVGKYRGQTEPGSYGRRSDDPSLVMLDIIGDDGPATTIDLMEELGPENADLITRRLNVHGTPPVGWETENPDGTTTYRLSEILYETTQPGVGVTQADANQAAVWLLESAGNPGDQHDLAVNAATGDAVEKIFIDNPTAMIQSRGGGRILEVGGQERGEIDDELNETTVDNALEAVFLSGEGDELMALKELLIPTAIAEGLNTGNGDPEAMTNTAWLGEIDGRIDGGMSRADIVEASDLDARNTRSQAVLNVVAGSYVAGVPGVRALIIGDVTGELIGAQLETLLPTNNELEAWKQRWQGENAETIVTRYQVLTTLDTAGRLDLPSGVTVNDVMNGDGPKIFDIPILDSEGNPLMNDGKPVTAEDWYQQFALYEASNDDVERDN